MINWIILFWIWLYPNPNHTPDNHGNSNPTQVSSSSESDDTGGETGNLPPKPPTPPPPPPPGG